MTILSKVDSKQQSDVTGADSLIDNIVKNWKPVTAVSVAVLFLAAGIYYYTKSPTPTPEPKKKKTKKTKPKQADVEANTATNTTTYETPSSSSSINLSSSTDLQSNEDKKEETKEFLASRAKEKGNKYYTAKEYQKALELYTEAIKLMPNGPDSHVYFGNRAACYQNLGNPEKALEDCNSSLSLNPKYGKVLSRRSSLLESSGNLEQSLDDMTACCIFDGFKSAQFIKSADTILKKISDAKLAEIMQKRSFELPSNSFVKSYLGSFCTEYQNPPSMEEEGDKLFAQSLELLQKMQYQESFEKALESQSKESNCKSDIFNLIGTYYYLMGDLDSAIKNFDSSLEANANNINTIIKRSCLLFEKKEIDKSLEGFETAISINENDPDIYYHRGQVYYLQGNFELALSDYEKSVELKSNVPFPLIQQAVVHYRNQAIQTAIGIFKSACKKFPKNGDVWNYYGEIMLDQGNLEEAENCFDKASELNPGDAMCIINKGVLEWRAKQNFEAAIDTMKKAIETDPKCEIVYAQLGQIYQQIGKQDECIESYDLAIKYTRSETELSQWISLREAAAAQFRVFKQFPDLAEMAKSLNAQPF